MTKLHTHFVYVLRCADNTLYTGYTTNLARRLSEHNGEGESKTARSAGARYTRVRRPVTLVYHESFTTRADAQTRERAIKQLTKTEKEKLVRQGE